MSSVEQLLTVDHEPGGIVWIRLNRPSAANATNVPLLKQLHDALARCGRDSEIRVVVLAGHGRHFSAGGDIKEFAAHLDDLPAHMVEITSWLNAVVLTMVRLPQPVVAAVHGVIAGGGGFGVMCATDMVVAAESARFVGPGTGIGMTPDAGTTVTLSQRIGFTGAMEMILMNTSLTAPEAHQRGLVTWVVPDGEVEGKARAVAQQLAAGPRLAIARAKQLMWAGVCDQLEAQLLVESHAIADLAAGPEVLEGITAVSEKRPARFTSSTDHGDRAD